MQVVTLERHRDDSITWKYWFDPDAGCFVGNCKSLNLTATGRTLAELRMRLDGVAQDLLRYVFGTGDLDDFLAAQAWSVAGFRLPNGFTPESVYFKVNWILEKGQPEIANV